MDEKRFEAHVNELGEILKGELDNGNYILVKKVSERELDGKFGKYYLINCEYGGEDVSFFLNAKMGEAYSLTGGEGSTVKITAKVVENPVRKGTYYKQFDFNLVE